MKTLPHVGATEREVHQAIRELTDGRSNAVGKVTLRPGQTTTVVEKPTINANAGVFLFPASASAVNVPLFVTVSPTGGAFTVTHNASSLTDRTFHYLVNGG